MSKVPGHIFRQYDIRGLVATDLRPDVAELVGRAFGTTARRQGRVGAVIVGRDHRASSPDLASAFRRGVRSTGLDVVDIGIVPTPLLYYATHRLGGAGGVQITGSHNPPEYNGIKMNLGTESMFGDEILGLLALIESDELERSPVPGKERREDVIEPYLKEMKQNLGFDGSGLVAVVDAGNGTGGVIAVPLLESLGVKVIPLFCDMDSSFPNHHPDPTLLENLADCIAAVKEHRADVGLAYDGDADRLGVIDELGNVIWGDRLLAVFAREILAEQPGATVIGEVKCSKVLYDSVAAAGGKAVMWKAGHSLIKAKMRETGAVLGGEMSGHLFFKHRYYGFDDGIYASGRLLEILAKKRKPLSQLLNLPYTFATEEIRVDCPDDEKFALVKRAVEHFRARHDVVDVDGVRIIFPDGWGLIRASNTQPVLVLRFEADTEVRCLEIRKYVESELARIRA